MKSNQLITLCMALSLSACMSVPPDTIALSQTIGRDLEHLHHSHRQMAKIQFANIKQEINTFVDEVYAPFVINFVLKEELVRFQQQKPSLYGSIEAAGKIGGEPEIQKAVTDMFEFQEAAQKAIEAKRAELLAPILLQEKDILENIKQSYANLSYGNAAVTNYLESVQKMKQTQGHALQRVGLKDMVDNANLSLTRVSSFVSNALANSNNIDINSDTAYKQIEDISNQIKDINEKN